MKRWAVVLILCALVGCGSSFSEPSPTDGGSSASKASAVKDDINKTYRIAVIPKGTSHEFWKSVHAGAEKAAKEFGNVEILWSGPQLESDTNGQITVVENFITSKVDGICLAPLDSQALVESVVGATEQGIPVVIFDSGLDDETHIISYVATDNYKGGELAGREMGRLLEEGGNVIMLRYKAGSESTEQREQGFLDTLANEFPQVNLLTADEYAGTTPEESLTKATQVLGKYKDEVNGIFAVCEPNATGVLGALDLLELKGKVNFVAFDPNNPLIDGMTSGDVNAIVLQDPVKMGYLSVKTMIQKLHGETVEKRIDTGEYVATPENMNTPEMQMLLKPEQYEE
ncbi:MAG: substrate-binding domain-containing protein [Planctomycetota bacterium]|nr:substrate-binding domain-containing protein [Planctomycetota bacterium]